MTITWKQEWTELSEKLVADGLFETPDAAAEAAFDLLRAQAEKHAWLKARIDEAIDEDVWLTPEEAHAELEAHLEALEREGFR